MKVLIVGSGGREHVLAWKVSKSSKVDKIYCAPGNAGIAGIAECVPIKAMEFDKLTDFASKEGIDLTIVGMDDPLVGGIVDAFEAVYICHEQIERVLGTGPQHHSIQILVAALAVADTGQSIMINHVGLNG